MQEHLYVVSYDISDSKRWRRVFNLLNGYGQWLQLSVFQCRLSQRRHAELMALLDESILNGHDHVVMLDLGPADSVAPKVISLGRGFESVQRQPTVI